MPTPANSRYNKPASWDEFEDICLSSFKTRWKSPNLQRHGRQGQPQLGVDIYGLDNLSQSVGIQCKNTVHSISKAIVDAEIAEAENFKPPLRSLYIATSADSDVTLQAYVRGLSASRAAAGKFSVDIVFWDAIEHDLSGDLTEVAKHYPWIFAPAPASAMVPAAMPPAAQSGPSRRDRDVQNLNRLLSAIDIEATSFYLGHAPKYVNIKFLEHTSNILGITNSPTFGLNDPQLQSSLQSYLNQWLQLASLIRDTPAYELVPGGDTLSFRMVGDAIRDPSEQEQYDLIEQADQEFFRLQQLFCDFIRANYVEIDLSQTSKAARQLY